MKFKLLVMLPLFFGVVALNSCKEKGKPAVESDVAPSGATTFSDTSSSMVRVFTENGKVCIQKTNTYYELADVYEGAAKTPLLLKIKKTELCVADSTNKDKVYEIEAKNVLDTKDVKWKAQFVATEMSMRDNTVLAVHEGNDTEEDFLTRFSLLDGKEIFSCSYGELKAIVPNVRNKRFIGFTSKKATSEPVQNLQQENLLGIVRYSDGTKEVNALKVMLKRSGVSAKIPQYTPDMVLVPSSANATAIEEGKSIIMMKADEHYTPKDLTGFSVQLTFYYGDDNESTIILIPVADDRLDFAHAKFDKDIFDITAL
jgi:hypothetical protein